MASSKFPTTQESPSVAAIIAQAEQDSTVSNKASLIEFIRLFCQSIPRDLVQTFDEARHWYDLTKSQWLFMLERKPLEIKLRVFNPEELKDGFGGDYSLVELGMQDMPFLVDSMRIGLQALAVPIIQMTYVGGLHVVRNEDDEMVGVYANNERTKKKAKTHVSFEAPILIQIERQTTPARLKEIEAKLHAIVADVVLVNQDWRAMTDHVEALIDTFKVPIEGVSQTDERESRAFLQWLLKDHFTFLGLREYCLVDEKGRQGLELIPDSGMGVLKEANESSQFRSFASLSEAARSLATSPMPCIELGKTNTKATVHRPVYTDYIGVKRYKDGRVVGFCRIIGLYTSLAYRALPENIPFIRRKIKTVLQRSGFAPNSHPGKDLLHMLHTFPRDDLFHASTDELFDITKGIMALQERRCIRLFPRIDRFGRFVSCMVFVPRENFTTNLAEKMRMIIGEYLDASEVMMDTYFSSSVLVRIHFVVRLGPDHPKKFDFAALEQALMDTGLSWQDTLLKVLHGDRDVDEAQCIFDQYRHAFGGAYRDRFTPCDAKKDIAFLSNLSDAAPLGVQFYKRVAAEESAIQLKLYRQDQPLTLSDVVPLLENIGFTVLSEDSYRLPVSNHQEFWISDFNLALQGEHEILPLERINALCAPALLKTWSGILDNDGFNRLMLEADLTWKDILLLRAYAKYLRQLSFPFSQEAMERALCENPAIAKELVAYFTARFDPEFTGNRSQTCQKIEKTIMAMLEQVQGLDQDRVIRLYLRLMQATLRTNHYLPESDIIPLALKLNPSSIPDVPKPVPAYEIFVYSARIEGVHLRAAKVARGGLRWSDRGEDYRTEVLGLMKAQQVKNSVIVPAGAKGGFVAKRLHPQMSRDEMMAEGVACYQLFIRSLLDMVDNLSKDGQVLKKDLIRYDDDDYYLVVAADKGTATFSDIANAISKEYNYWLGDAFASGGSVGYDHKKMGITARGAWVSAQRHFLDMGRNADADPITVVGIGDMSGDVFGNGMLMSKKMQLVAAFNHQHIFIDPNPDAEKSYQERKRLFDMPRSSWADYRTEVLSEGGGVYRRDAKSITLSKEAQKRLGIRKSVIVPDDLIHAILLAPVDMLWNGGIGTYVKSANETNEEVGDRANDLIRVDGDELRCKIVCEGGNLGATQLGRVDYAVAGGNINTDFIDNSAGVDCSDHEVNIKILLGQLISTNQLPSEDREKLLADMEPEVGRLVLLDNYRQNQTLSLVGTKTVSHLGLYMAFMKELERSGILDRKLSGLPTAQQLIARQTKNEGLTKPELAVLFSTAKNNLKDEILSSSLVDDPNLQDFIYHAFPAVLKQRYAPAILKHRLHKDLLATQLSNTLISDMGIAFIFQMMQETDASLEAIIRAYVAARSIYDTGNTYLEVASLDYVVNIKIQHAILLEGMRLVRQAVRWFLAQPKSTDLDIAHTILLYRESVIALFSRVEKLLVGDDLDHFHKYKAKLLKAGVPEGLAQRVASGRSMYHALNIVQASIACGVTVYRVAKTYFLLSNQMHFGQLRTAINQYPSDTRWAVLAKAAFNADLDVIQRAAVIDVLTHSDLGGDVKAKIAGWCHKHAAIISRYEALLSNLRSQKTPDFAIITVAIRLLRSLVNTEASQML